ncbi:MAG: alpha/beta fold hydrolase [Dehalococcoidia bacterium]
MVAPVNPAVRRIPVRGIELAVREWPGGGTPFLLVHGLASNARTWDHVAEYLNERGHRVVSVDQRGHGLSDKPDEGYGFDEVTADLNELIQQLGMDRPVLAGQSWGGNVVLDYGSRWPDTVRGLVLVDGGFIDLASDPEATWEQISIDLKPPHLIGTPRDRMLERMRGFHADWPEETLEMAMANFETMEDGTIRPWLTLDRHMQIVRALWDQRPSELYPLVPVPTMVAVADAGMNQRRHERKVSEIAALEASLPVSRVRWFHETHHDIHMERPADLAQWMIDGLEDGFFA